MKRGWLLVLGVAVALAVASLAANVTTTDELLGRANALAVVRLSVSKLLNAGVVWAGLAVLSGWAVGRGVRAAAAGIVAFLLALVTHYGLGVLVGLFEPDVWSSNAYWFAAAILLGPFLGLVGAASRRADPIGVLARLVVPTGAILEPFVLGAFTSSEVLPWPGRVSSVVSGVALLVAGAIGAIAVLVAARQRPTDSDDR